MPEFRELRRNHDFTVLWAAQTASEVGSQVSLFVVPLVAFALTGSTLVAGLAGGADLLGTALGLLPGGVLADRVDRRRVLRTAAGVGALAYASVVGAGLTGELSIVHLAAAAFLTGVTTGLMTPAEAAAVRDVVAPEQLPTALAQMQARQHVASLVGAPVGGLLLAVARWVPFLLDTATFAVAWAALGRIRTDLSPGSSRGSRRPGGRQVATGFALTWRRPLYRTLMLWSAGSNLVTNALFVAANLRLVQAGFPAWSIGLVSTAAGVAGVLGSIAAPSIIERVATGRLTIAVAWSFVPLLAPLALWNHPAVVAAALACGVFLNPVGNAGIGAYKTAVTPPDLLGRVTATSALASWSTMPLAPLLGGGLLALVGGRDAIALLGVLVALVATVPTLDRTVRAVPRPREWPAAEQVEWDRAGGGQRLPAGQASRRPAEGSDGAAQRLPGAAAGDA